ncbi:hypothetical protein I3760_14G049200 [Carya illinoinensis]|uniref:Calcium uniporter protein C-terminal domain-containing protein n=1 Tax=Carya illinoinensis TaxID=32201 RepID=A0A8T1NB49_CARIL|nr:calcium uniporter protein 6, mitochondrial-like [Carya illinoinensis]KAG2669764.1 hypothetical protein I3760_14G049200 [Carya illinoinensis]KAG6628929.1 hypothetical protein CIPAW_14G047100 [Carya illinoinensis]KAG6677884.1 hypothetical protein I3842_14G050200 [Carya illinoinensis]
MWRRWWSGGAVKQSVSVVLGQFNGRKMKPPNPSQILGLRVIVPASSLWLRTSSTSPPSSSPLCADSNTGGSSDSVISFAEAKKVMRLVNVEELKRRLGTEGKEVISYSELLDACQSMGVARSPEEAAAFARVLDEAGVILLFRHKVYLHPDKVVDLVRRAVPLALTSEDDPVRDELKRLQEKKEEIDVLAHKQVRRILWTGLGIAVVQVGLFFRLTFWEYSWDVMEPIAFFTTTTGIVIGYAYFLFTSRDPTYQDLMKRLFLARQRKLIKKHDFNCQRYKELQDKCKTCLHATASIKNRVGLEVELEDALHRD